MLCVLAAPVLPGCAAPQARPEGAPAARIFELRSDFWVNLHERLFAETNPPHFAHLEEQEGAAAYTPDERAGWDAALALYRARFPERSILVTLEPPLSDLHRRLALQAERPDLAGAGLDAELASTLARAAAVYRAHGWAADERSNRAWIAGLEPRLERLGGEYARALAAAYETRWPEGPIRVEVAIRAGIVGAYTQGDPPLVTIASGLPSYQGDAALEMVFHEASHVVSDPGLEAAIDRACRARGRAVPGSLWHAVLFYTAGEIARRLIPGYTPYATVNGLYARAPGWDAAERAMHAAWRPHLERSVGLDAAVGALIAALPVEAPPGP